MTRKQRRLTLIILALILVSIASALILFGLKEKITFFYSPSDIIEKKVEKNLRIRIGGLVEESSLNEHENSTMVTFNVTDLENNLSVKFNGILPDLFREGQGVVAIGKIGTDGVFMAETILAKHDENYMPKEVADSLKDQGLWKDAKVDTKNEKDK